MQENGVSVMRAMQITTETRVTQLCGYYNYENILKLINVIDNVKYCRD